MRFLAACFVGGLVAVVSAVPSLSGQTTRDATPFSRMFDAYAAGDYNVVVRTLKTEQDLGAMLRDYNAALITGAGWRGDPSWRRVNPAFGLEIAAVAALHHWPGADQLFNAAGRLVVQRSDRIGDTPGDDAFEILVHRAAVALAQEVRAPDALERYARLYEDRVSADPPRVFTRRIVDPRFLLSHAIAGDQHASQIELYLEEAARRYRLAARYEVNAAEASVRLSWVLHRLGRFAEGLAALETFEATTSDGELIYLGRLFRGRLLTGLGRIDDAARAYEHALAAWPLAQAPAVALSALHLLNDRRDLSLQWATVVRTQRAGPLDPWWHYPTGEGRFFQARLSEVRQAIR